MVAPAIAAAGIAAGAGLVGGLFGSRSNSRAAARNAQGQREFAQHGIRWRVADAKAAGIHPLYAMGASTPSFSPSFVGGSPVGESLAQAGQDVSRAMHATRTEKERREAEALSLVRQKGLDARAQAMFDADLANKRLQNDLLSAQIAKLKAAPNPPMPESVASPSSGGVTGSWRGLRPGTSTGQRLLDQVTIEPSKITSANPRSQGTEAGVKPGSQRIRLGGGTTIDLPSQGVSEALESIPMGGPLFMMANDLDKGLRGPAGSKPSDDLLPKTHKWVWSILRQAWTAERK